MYALHSVHDDKAKDYLFGSSYGIQSMLNICARYCVCTAFSMQKLCKSPSCIDSHITDGTSQVATQVRKVIPRIAHMSSTRQADDQGEAKLPCKSPLPSQTNTGYFSRLKVLPTVGDGRMSVLTQVFQGVDTNQDGLISRQEVC
jgi:hypothetical protein